jgi:putative membrane protein
VPDVDNSRATDKSPSDACSSRPAAQDPDYRFTLANERTFLAWLRTALALIAGGVALASLAPAPNLREVRLPLAVGLLALALLLSAGSYWRWTRIERSMRLGRSLPHGVLPRLLAAGITTVATVLLVLVLSDLPRR